MLVHFPVFACGCGDQDRLIKRAPELNGGCDAAAQEGNGNSVAHHAIILSKVSVSGQRHVHNPVTAPRIWRAIEEDDRSAIGVRDCDPFFLGGVGQFWNPFVRAPGYRPQSKELWKSNPLGGFGLEAGPHLGSQAGFALGGQWAFKQRRASFRDRGLWLWPRSRQEKAGLAPGLLELGSTETHLMRVAS